MERVLIRHRTVEANGISMHVAESGGAGEGEGTSKGTVLFLHGFPELWYSWRHQMEHLSARGYHCVAPDLRGYGGTTAPPDVESYTAFHIVGDVVALLDALEISKVFLVGHDWGAIIAWYVCLFRPDRVTALVNTSVAFMRGVMARTGPEFVNPIESFNRTYGPEFYMCRFQEPGGAAEARQFAPERARRSCARSSATASATECTVRRRWATTSTRRRRSLHGSPRPTWSSSGPSSRGPGSPAPSTTTATSTGTASWRRRGRTPRCRCPPSTWLGTGTSRTTSTGSRSTSTAAGSRRTCRCWRRWWSSPAPATSSSRRRRRRSATTSTNSSPSSQLINDQ